MKRLKIVFLTGNFHPEYTGIAVHATDLAKEFLKLGHEVNVFTSFPYYPNWRIGPNYRGKIFDRYNYKGINVYRNWLYLPPKKSITTKYRMIAELSFLILQILNLIRHEKIVKHSDVIMVFSPFFLQGISAIILKKAWNIPYIFHVEDIQPDSAIDTGLLRNNNIMFRLIIELLKSLEKTFYKNSLVVSTLTKGMRKNIISKMDNYRDKVTILGYWVNTKKYFSSEELRKLFRNKYDYQEDELLIGYAGNIGKKQNINKLVEIINELGKRSNKIKFIIAGEGAYKRELKKLIIGKKNRNLRILPLQRDLDYVSFLNGVDLSFISQDENAKNIFIPSKLYPTLSCGSVIVCFANKNSELYNIIKDSNSGYVYEWNQVNKFIKNMLYLADDKIKLNNKRMMAKKYAISNFSKEVVLSPIVNVLNSIAKI